MATRLSDHGFKHREHVKEKAGLQRVGKIIQFADDEDMALVRWDGGVVCDWVQLKDLVHADG